MGGGSSKQKKVRLGSSQGAAPPTGIVPEAGADSASNRAEGATEDAAAEAEKSIEAAYQKARAPSGVTGETAARIAADEQRENLRRTSVGLRVVKGDSEGTSLGPIQLRFDAKVASVGSGEKNQFCIPGLEEEHGMISYIGDQLLYVNSSDSRTVIDGKPIDLDAGPVEIGNGSTIILGESTELSLTSFTDFIDPATD